MGYLSKTNHQRKLCAMIVVKANVWKIWLKVLRHDIRTDHGVERPGKHPNTCHPPESCAMGVVPGLYMDPTVRLLWPAKEGYGLLLLVNTNAI